MPHNTPDYYAHPTAILDEGCQVGRGSRIWHFCHISAGADLGEDCNLGQNVFVADGVTLGRNVKVQNNVSLYGGVVCEDDVFLGPSVVFTNVKNPRSAVPRKGPGQYLTTYLEQRRHHRGQCHHRVRGAAGALRLRGRGQRGHARRAGLRPRVWHARPAAGLDECLRPPARFRRTAGRATCPESGEKYELSADGLAVRPVVAKPTKSSKASS